jgi:S-adenosylmethionine/arginine decarboxylase-like enzyme
MYGKELILDIHECNTSDFNRKGLKEFFDILCKNIKMEQCDLHFWDYEDPEEYAKAPIHLKGTSAIQFITTSNITVHTLDELNRVYLNIFSCKDFDAVYVGRFVESFFRGKIVNSTVVDRI